MTTEPELKPCSECYQENPEYREHKPIFSKQYKIFCSNCGIEVNSYDKDLTISKWNRRA